MTFYFDPSSKTFNGLLLSEVSPYVYLFNYKHLCDFTGYPEYFQGLLK